MATPVSSFPLRSLRSTRGLVAAFLLGAPASAQSTLALPVGHAAACSEPPVITIDLADDAVAPRGETLRFRVSAQDPDGDSVSLKLLNPPPGLIFAPVVDGGAQVAEEVRWLIGGSRAYPGGGGGLYELRFEAHDDRCPHRRTARSVRVRIVGPSSSTGLVEGDVTGDGVPDVVAIASHADVAGVENTGAAYVWAGGRQPSGDVGPTATLTVPGAAREDRLGTWNGQAMQLVDVTGDGVLDVVIGTSVAKTDKGEGAIYVWAGGPGLTGSVAPRASLVGVDELGYEDGVQSMQIADVTGDGVADLISGSPSANANGVWESGAVYVWAGGDSLAGEQAPSATLTVRSAAPGDRLGGVHSLGYGPRLVDVTADGRLDIVVAAPQADVDGVADAGAIYVWPGGPEMVGASSPVATLTVPDASAYDLLGWKSDSPVYFEDVTGDGRLDILSAAPSADIGGVVNAGAVYVWLGGDGLAGPMKPIAKLALATPEAFDDVGRTVRFGDVTSDGRTDVIVGAQGAGGSVLAPGAIHVWSGHAMTGKPLPRATLSVSTAGPGDGAGMRLIVADVTADGVADVVWPNWVADVGGVKDNGAIFLWGGSASLSGPQQPQATLRVPAGNPYWQLGDVRLVDVSKDGTLDLVAHSHMAEIGGLPHVGAAYFWLGGAHLTGTKLPRATLRLPGAGPYLWLGEQSGVQLADVDNNGRLDAVAGSYRVGIDGVPEAGAVFIWSDVAHRKGQLAPDATLVDPDAGPKDQLGTSGIRIADLDGDGLLDIVAASSSTNVAGVHRAGAMYVWKGHADLLGNGAPSARLTVPGAVAYDALADSSGRVGIRLADVTGDGQIDLITSAGYADVNGVVDAGAIYVWSGPDAFSGPPPTRFRVPGAESQDRLTE